MEILNELLDSITNLALNTVFLALIFLTVFFNNASSTPRIIFMVVRIIQMFAIVLTTIVLGSYFALHGYELVMSTVSGLSST
jgi:hypothetical protein